NRDQGIHQWCTRIFKRICTCCARTEQQDTQGKECQNQHGTNQATRQGFGWLFGLLGCQRDTFNCQKKPDRIRYCCPDAQIAQWQETACTRSFSTDRNIKQVCTIKMGQHAKDEHHQGNRSNCGNHEHDFECFTSTFQMQTHKHQIAHQINAPAANTKQGFAISTNKTGNCCRSDGILNQDGTSGQIAAKGTKSSPGKTVSPTRSRQHGRHFRHGQTHTQIHECHHNGRNKHTSPTRLCQTKIPTGEVTGNHIRDPQTDEKQPTYGAFLELAQGKIIFLYCCFSHTGINHTF